MLRIPTSREQWILQATIFRTRLVHFVIKKDAPCLATFTHVLYKFSVACFAHFWTTGDVLAPLVHHGRRTLAASNGAPLLLRQRQLRQTASTVVVVVVGQWVIRRWLTTMLTWSLLVVRMGAY
jgi:hypothetical protein